jgi:hypothetical protein
LKLDSIPIFVVLPQGWSSCDLLSFATFGCGGVLLFTEQVSSPVEKLEGKRTTPFRTESKATWLPSWERHELEADA